MKKLFSLMLVFSAVLLAGLDIDHSFQIVTGTVNGGPEEMAGPTLARHLGKVFGKKMVIVDRAKADLKKPSIILERDKKLDLEEWSIKVEKNNLYIRGGFPRGIFYGVCEFLERFAGVRWFTAYEIKIPRAVKLTVPEGREFRGKPIFPLLRSIGDSIGAKIPNRDHLIFKAHQRQSYFPNALPDKRRISYFRSYTLGDGHSFFRLTKAVPKGQEHLLPLDAGGRPVRTTNALGPAQLCFSNKAFREFSKKEIAKWIADAEKMYKKYNYHIPITIVDLSQNDNNNFCQCRGCRELYQKYGTVSGAMLEYINDIASAFPDKVFQTFAYGATVEPPKGIKARDNVMIHFAFLGSDILRPLSAPSNARFVQYYKAWDKIAKRKAIWAYHRAYRMTEQFEWPQCCFWYIGEDMRFYHEFGMEKLSLETESMAHGLITLRAFHDLHVYLASRFSVNPTLNDEELINEFMDYVYGPAAPEMKAYAAYLKKRYEAVPGQLNAMPLPSRPFFDEDYFRTVKGLLDRAEAKARQAGNKKLLDLITLEKYPFYVAALNMWSRFGKIMGGDRQKIADTAEKAIDIFCKRYQPIQNKLSRTYRENTLNLIKSLRYPMPVPPGMEKLNIVQIPMAIEFGAIPDKDAWMGKTRAAKYVSDNSIYAHRKHLLQAGIYDLTEKRAVVHKFFMPGEIKQDEKYHLYSLGRFVPNVFNNYCGWAHVTWALSLPRVLRPAIDQQDPGREFEVFFSLKVTGPAYVKNSKKPNGIFLDKIVVVKHGIVKEKFARAVPEAAAKAAPAKGKVFFNPRNVTFFQSVRKGIGPMGAGVFVMMNGSSALSAQQFKYDPAKTYRFSCKARIVSEKEGTLFIGMAPYDAQGRAIKSRHVLAVAGSDTVLAAPAGKGAKKIMLKDCSRWNTKVPFSNIAFNTRADRSDLPNRDLITLRGKVLVKKGNVWELTLSQPLARDYPAGTAVRQHLYGPGYIYAIQKKLGRDEVLLNGMIRKGVVWPGTASFKVSVVFVGKNPRTVAEFKDLQCSAQ